MAATDRASRYRARLALEQVLHSKALARIITKKIYIRSGKHHTTYMDDVRALIKLLKVAKPAKPISANGVLGLAETLKRKRFRQVNKFVVTDTKAEQVRQAKAMEDGRTGKSGFVAH